MMVTQTKFQMNRRWNASEMFQLRRKVEKRASVPSTMRKLRKIHFSEEHTTSRVRNCRRDHPIRSDSMAQAVTKFFAEAEGYDIKKLDQQFSTCRVKPMVEKSGKASRGNLRNN